MSSAVPATFFSLEKFGLALLFTPGSLRMELAQVSDMGLGFRYCGHDGAVLGAVIVACIRLIGHSKNSPGESAMIILRERFAKGEIEKDEFATKKRELSQGSYRERNLKGGVQWKIRMSNTGST